MPLVKVSPEQVLERIDAFDRIVDARSPGEFLEDRVPGAVNWPVLDDQERALVGTQYKQVSPFEARKQGAVLASRNIARHVERELGGIARDWQPLVYCWRGGQRSGSLALVLSEIGFRVQLIDGGYRGFRRAVTAALNELPQRFQYKVLCGATGSGKSRLLQALHALGAQVLDLERLANHRGSVLGLVPGSPQPSQKAFDTLVWNALRRFDPTRPVWVESESKKVGALRVPDALMTVMRQSTCLHVDLDVESRVRLLMTDYDFFVNDVDSFCERLDALRELRGNEVINRWQARARSGELEAVVRELLTLHYDPIYRQSTERNFAGFRSGRVLSLPDGDWPTLKATAAALAEEDLR